MRTVLTTSEVAEFLGTTEPRINGLIRRRALTSAPPIHSGRRLWFRQHIDSLIEALRASGHEIQVDDQFLGDEVS